MTIHWTDRRWDEMQQLDDNIRTWVYRTQDEKEFAPNYYMSKRIEWQADIDFILSNIKFSERMDRKI